MSIHKKFVFGVIVIILCLGLGTWIYDQKRTITLSLGVFSGSNWEVPETDSYELLDQAISEFEATHPNVRIVYESGIRKEQYEEWLAQKTMKEEQPDLYFVPSELFSTFVQNNSLQNLRSFITEDENFSLEDYYHTSLMEGDLDEQIYALPYESVPSLMFVNKTLLEQEGIAMPDQNWTWDDFYELCRAVTKDRNQDGTIDQFGYYGYTWQQAAYSNGVQLYDESTHEIRLDDERVIETIDFLRKCTALHDERVTSVAFDKGQVAFCPMYYSTYRTYMPYPWRVKKFSNFEWDIIPFPKGPQGTNTSQIDTLMIGMSTQSSHQRLAWEFMKYLSSDQNYQKKLTMSSQGISVLKSVMKDQEVMDALNAENPGNSQFEMSIIDTVMKQGIAIRKTKEYEQIMQSADAEIMNLLINDQDIENRLIVLEHQLNALLSK